MFCDKPLSPLLRFSANNGGDGGYEKHIVAPSLRKGNRNKMFLKRVFFWEEQLSPKKICLNRGFAMRANNGNNDSPKRNPTFL